MISPDYKKWIGAVLLMVGYQLCWIGLSYLTIKSLFIIPLASSRVSFLLPAGLLALLVGGYLIDRFKNFKKFFIYTLAISFSIASLFTMAGLFLGAVQRDPQPAIPTLIAYVMLAVFGWLYLWLTGSLKKRPIIEVRQS